MERQQCKSLQNFDESKNEILKKRLLKSAITSVGGNLSQNNSQHNVLLNTLRAPISNSMIVSSVPAPQSSMPITHNLVTHSIAPVKIHTTTSPYPLQLSTVHVPVQIPGSTSNINVPVQLTGATTSVPLQITPVSLPIQVSGTTSVPVQLPAGDTINVPLQIPANGQNIQLTGPGLPSMPILQNTSQPLHSSIFHVHMGSNQRPTHIDGTELSVSTSSQLLPDSSVQVKMSNPQVQVGSNTNVVQIPNTSNNSIQLTLPSSGSAGTVQLRGAGRSHVVYIQTPTGLKPVTSTEVISQASTSGNPPQIIVRRPVTCNSNTLHLIPNVGSKQNIAPKLQNKTSILAPANVSQPIVIQKPKVTEKMIVPVSIASGAQGKQAIIASGAQGKQAIIASGAQGKQAIAYLSSVKKATTKTTAENQSILISNNQTNVNTNNQKLFLTPMNMPKIQNSKFILPVTLPATMASKGPIINLQIANGQIQNDPQGNITVMRETANMETSEMPPLQPLAKMLSVNGKECNPVPQNPKSDKGFAISISGSRAEPTGEQGEYTLSIPETNSSMNDDVYTVSIADEDGGHREKSFTLAIPEKSKSLLNKNIIDRSDMGPATIAAPAILRRSNSDNSERKVTNANIKRRISLCNENFANKHFKLSQAKALSKLEQQETETETNDDHRVPSLFCDEKLEEAKVVLGDSDPEDYKESKTDATAEISNNEANYHDYVARDCSRPIRDSFDSSVEEDPPGLIWNNGVATLQGSTVQFQTNEFGLIDIIDANDQEEILIPSTKYHTPLKQRIDRSGREKKPMSPEDLYRCDGCGCHGMAAEFITPNFCSVTCQSEVQKEAQKKRDKERAEVMKKRNKMRKLLMRQQHSDTGEEKVPLKLFDLTAELQSDTSQPKVNEDMIENEKYPWMCGKNGFSWMRYLDFCKAKAAPVKLFKDPFPYTRNNFKVGMRMEAIDPQHPALFCVVSVAEVQGYRMRLHFDEYPGVYDYWVNADCADIFPAGWCEKNGRCLKPPASFSTANFSWPMYLRQTHAIAAPKYLFAHVTNVNLLKPHGFRIGMKLEAEDRKNELVCVATVADMLDNRLLINFDSWDEMYDYWVEPSSPYIHPVGWAEENGVALTPPNFYKDPETFSWENYLAETGTSPVPPRAFKTRQPSGFKPGMKLEVVDPKVPFLIRVATVGSVRGHQVQVQFDGWEELSCWLDDDSPDLHPVGWCLKTQHPLEPPLTAEDLSIPGPCGVGGCRGLGSARGGAHKTHAAASACPYRAPAPPPDRLAPFPSAPTVAHATPRPRTFPPKEPKAMETSTPTSDSQKERISAKGRPPKHKRIEQVSKEDLSEDESVSSAEQGRKRWRASPRPLRTYSRATPPAPSPRPAAPPPRAPRPPAHKYLADLQLPNNPTLWTQHDVAALITLVAGDGAAAACAAARLSGAELVMASREELVDCLQLRLGPAIKVYSAVRQLRDTLT